MEQPKRKTFDLVRLKQLRDFLVCPTERAWEEFSLESDEIAYCYDELKEGYEDMFVDLLNIVDNMIEKTEGVKGRCCI